MMEYLAAAVLIIAGIFGLTGSYGLLKLHNTMQRMHAPTKATTVGVGGALLASFIVSVVLRGVFTWHEILITLFLLLTAPITANMLAKAQMHRHIAEGDLPPTGRGNTWATYTDDDRAPENPDPMVKK
jgi:multicomponent K+:H+ antiporter subunit G